MAKARKVPKLPVQQLVILALCRLADPISFSSVFPYLPEMIESFNVPKDEVGRWAGVSSAVFSLSQATTAIFWGRASDRFGRKPVILTAMICVMSTGLLFGFSQNLAMAIVARSLAGASNGNVGILRTTVAEIVPWKELQPRAFSVMPLMWTIGSIFGPGLGGALANPAARYPHNFGNDFFRKFPYALPNIAASLFFFIGLTAGSLFLKESLESKKHRRDYGRVFGKSIMRMFKKKPRKSHLSGDDEQFASFLKPSRASSVSSDETTSQGRHRPVVHKAPTYREACVHAPQTLLPSLKLIVQFLIFPPLARQYGILNSLKVVTVIFPLVYMATPFTALLPNPSTQQIVMFVIMLVKCLATIFAFPCTTILLTNSAVSLRVLGTLNGVATSVSAVGRATGPALSGVMFETGSKKGWAILPWWVLAGFAVLGAIPVWWLVEMEGFGGSDDDDDGQEGHEEPEVPQAEDGESTEHFVIGSLGTMSRNETDGFIDEPEELLSTSGLSRMVS
ncbi:MAG: hypothetical protein Q9171_005707 [Xanthocarpia ochracea]